MSALFAAVFAMIAPSSSSASIVTDLTCEYLAQPLAVATTEPRLSWISQSSAKNWRQGAYQILVASTPEKLAKNEGDLWDSGKVKSDDSIQIVYKGRSLRSGQACFWKVRTWDAEGNESGWSKPQTWEMGLLQPTDWKNSQWIGGKPGDKLPLPAPYLRKEFEAKGKIKRARLHASGLAYAELSLNGKKLGGASERDPGYTNYDKRVLYVTHDVTKDIKSGKNCLGAILGTGWYDVHDRATWRFEKAPWRDRPRMRVLLDIEYADGTSETVVSDSSWKTSSGPIISDGIYSGEVYDARLEMPNWNKVGFKDDAWSSATKLSAPKGSLAPLTCPPVVVSQTIKPKSITEPKPGVYVLDFGQNFSGHVRLKLKGEAGSKVTMRYSERIDKTGMVQRSEIDVYMNKETPIQPFQTDVYICKGQGQETWEQRFSYEGFQYVEVTGFPGKPTLENFEGRFAHTDVSSAGEFSCSSELFNKIQHATRYAYYSNAQNIPTDCPQREKNGWTGDAHLACEAGLMNFKSASFYTKWLDDVADDQKADGHFSLIIPSGGWGQGALHPSWDSAMGIIANDMDLYQGDTRLLTKHYDHIRKYVDLIASQTKDGVIPFGSLGDWLPWKTETPSELTSTVMLFIDAKIVAKAASLKGDTEAAAKYADLAEATKTAYQKKFLSTEYSSLSQTALSLSLYFDLVPTEKRKAMFDALVANVEKQGHIDTGIIGAKYLLRILSEEGRTDLAYRIVARKEQPGWGWWMEQGATTLWEDWKGESSLNHIMFGDVSNWFFQWIAGIGLDPKVKAFKHIIIRPQPVGDLTWAKATYNSPYGKILSSWKKDAKGFHLDVEIPANTSATVWLPGSKASQKIGSGKYHFESISL